MFLTGLGRSDLVHTMGDTGYSTFRDMQKAGMVRANKGQISINSKRHGSHQTRKPEERSYTI